MVGTRCSSPCIQCGGGLLFDSETVAPPDQRRGDSGREELRREEGRQVLGTAGAAQRPALVSRPL